MPNSLTCASASTRPEAVTPTCAAISESSSPAGGIKKPEQIASGYSTLAHAKAGGLSAPDD
jgi:hypothetical protein